MKILNLYLAVVAVLIDAVAVLAGLYVAYLVRSHGGELFDWPITTYIHRAIAVTPIWLILFASQGLYDPRSLPRGWNGLGRVLIGLVAAWGIVLIILYFWRSPEALTMSRLLIAYAVALTTIFAVFGRLILGFIIDILFRTGAGSTKTVIIDGNSDGPLVRKLTKEWIHGRKVIGSFSVDQALEKLAALSRIEKVEEVIVDHPTISEEQLLSFLNWAELHGANFAVVPSLLSVRATNVETVTLAETPMMFFLRTPLEGWRRVYKRFFDLVVTTLLLLILSPIFLLLAILVKITSPGPAVFGQDRVGQDGSPVRVHKFRSMYADADRRHQEYGGWSGDERTDPRITPLGRLLRRTNLDELPQLWDIFVGRMSIVGPRPEQPHYVAKFAEQLPNYLHRLHVKSGLTGWAQVNGLRGDTSIEERVKYDLYYIEHWTIWFDLRIILATILLIFRQPFGR